MAVKKRRAIISMTKATRVKKAITKKKNTMKAKRVTLIKSTKNITSTRNMTRRKVDTTKKMNMETITKRKRARKVENMAIRSTTRRDRKPRDSKRITIKMISIKRRNSGIRKRKKVITRNMAANMSSMNLKRANTRKARRREKVMMRDTKARKATIRRDIMTTNTRAIKVNMVMKNTTITMTNMTKKVEKKVATRRDTNRRKAATNSQYPIPIIDIMYHKINGLFLFDAYYLFGHLIQLFFLKCNKLSFMRESNALQALKLWN